VIRRAPLALAAAVALSTLGAGPAAAQQAPLVADISSREIAITTGFAGADLLLFGAVEGRGDIVVVVRGPRRPSTVRHKSRIAGVWMNSDSRSFAGVPAYYHVASTRPIDQVAPRAVLERYEIGEQRLNFALSPGESGEDVEAYRDAFLRNKAQLGLYTGDNGTVEMIERRLFRTTVSFPANVPTGLYGVELYLFRDGRLISRKTTPLGVRKVGVEAEIYEYAHEHAAIYGAIAIAVALMAGWVAGAAFRRA
jgi:uncharacterized protein (TIGR02186 family)